MESAFGAELDASFADLFAAYDATPGLAVTVLGKRGTWQGAYGVMDVATQAPMQADATFRIASVTKTFVAAAALRLAEEGRIELDISCSAWLGAQSLTLLDSFGFDAEAISVRHLLQHTSGLADFASSPEYHQAVKAAPSRRWTRAEQVAIGLAVGGPSAKPGQAFCYSDTGYVLLGEILERVTGMDLGQVLRSHLGFDALHMSSTYLESIEPVPTQAGPRAGQYVATSDIRGMDPSMDLYGGGGLVSTTGDLACFARALFSGALYETSASLDTMLTQQSALGAEGWGSGVFRLPDPRGEWWGHTGYWGVVMAHHLPSQTSLAAVSTQLLGQGGINVTRLVELVNV